MCGLRAKWQWMINSKENRNRLTERNCLHVTSTAKHILNYWSNCYLQINIGRHFITKCWDDFLSISQRVKCSIDQFCFTFQHSPMITSFVWWLKITVADSLLSLVLLHNGLQQGSCIVPIFESCGERVKEIVNTMSRSSVLWDSWGFVVLQWQWYHWVVVGEQRASSWLVN